MIKTLIVDDDFLVRMFLKQITDWESAGFSLIGDACNGKEAISVIEKETPELVITDLSMPVMDGVSLIKRVKEASPDICIVVLSCHDEFEYVKEAMRLGADEYLLKNDLDEAVLLKSLESVRIKINKSAEIQQEKIELQRLAKKGTELVLQELLEELSGTPYSMEEQRRLCSSSGVPFKFRRCAAVTATAGQIAGSILQPVCEQYCRNKNAVCLGRIGQSCCILLDFSDLCSQAEQWERLNTFSEGLKSCILNYLNTEAAIGVSGINGGDGGICAALGQARLALKYRFYGYRIYRFSDLPAAGRLPEEAESLLQIQAYKPENHDEKLYRLGRSAFVSLRKTLLHPDRVREWFSALSKNFAIEGELPETLERMEEVWFSSAVSMKNEEGVPEKSGGNRAISQAVTYIRKHFHEPISLSKVAAEVHLNATYLSYLFKQEMGVNFSDYLTNCRLDRIRELLKESNRPIKEYAAAAGFQDYRNFCKLFKKETGMRPAEYRNLKK
ncbi:MAG TPA: response regulator [Anaerovoracaceae bacterium]|nr:response regulator [Anaerovoracaceae bacterium]